MLKLLFVDDEPYILQGLKVLVDYEKEGYEVFTAKDGEMALDIVTKNDIDLIIADIKMPVMNGVELLKRVSRINSDIYFVILSGYAEFSYAQEALRYGCADYILKPVEKEKLLEILRKVAESKADKVIRLNNTQKMEKAYFDQKLHEAFRGKLNEENLSYLKEKLPEGEKMCYVAIELDPVLDQSDTSDEEKNVYISKVYDIASDYLRDHSELLLRDGFADEKIYDIGFLYMSSIGRSLQKTDDEYLKEFEEYIRRVSDVPVIMLVGRMVSSIEGVSKSYTSVSMLHSLQGFREKKDIYFYEEEYQITDNGILLCKNKLDELISAIELNEQVLIRQKVDEFHEEMQKTGITGKTMNLNINYLLFQLIHLASQQDSEVNQEEILRLISENTFEEGINRGSKVHLYRMACEYGEYLAQLRKKVSKGVLAQVEDEIKKNYSGNLTLKDLSEKYFVNSAYLGQLFRKKYGCSFKDYLNRHRIEEAAMLLRKTDDKIYQIAERVGYRDVDYFVNKFIESKGCTPAKYRKQEL
jgi:two-component system response regulator YesN